MDRKIKMNKRSFSKAIKMLNISENDIKNLQRESSKIKIFFPLIGAIVVICSAVTGLLAGTANPVCVNCEGYPFARGMIAGALMHHSIRNGKLRRVVYVILIALLSVIAFLKAYAVGQRIFGYAIEYSVFSKEEILAD
jgi:hypothetical protein